MLTNSFPLAALTSSSSFLQPRLHLDNLFPDLFGFSFFRASEGTATGTISLYYLRRFSNLPVTMRVDFILSTAVLCLASKITASPIDQVVLGSNNDKRLIELSETQREWLTEDEVGATPVLVFHRTVF